MEPSVQDKIDYMAAHILAEKGVRVDASWTPDELANVFNILPRPRVSFPAWLAKKGTETEEFDEGAHNEIADKLTEQKVNQGNMARVSAGEGRITPPENTDHLPAAHVAGEQLK